MEKVSLKSKINVIRLELSKEMSKSGKNTYSKYDYFQLKDFMPKAIELMNENGVYTEFQIVSKRFDLPGKETTSCMYDENGERANEITTKEDSWEYKEVAVLDVYNVENEEEDMIHLEKPTANVSLQAAQPIQNLGGKSTYMKRYMYMDLFEINENDAVEEETGKPVKVETKAPSKASKKPTVTPVTTKADSVAPAPAKVEAPSTFETLPEPPSEEHVDATALMSMETKLELANKIKEVGLDPREEILNIAKELGTDVPLLKESDKEKVLEILNKKVGK